MCMCVRVCLYVGLDLKTIYRFLFRTRNRRYSLNIYYIFVESYDNIVTYVGYARIWVIGARIGFNNPMDGRVVGWKEEIDLRSTTAGDE